MDVTKAISANLGAWMEAAPGLNTIKQVAKRSGVGFGTIQRAKNGTGNTTIQNLAAIADAFKRRPEDLLTRPGASLPENAKLFVGERKPAPYSSLAMELARLADEMNEQGQWELMGAAKVLAKLYPRAPLKKG